MRKCVWYHFARVSRPRRRPTGLVGSSKLCPLFREGLKERVMSQLTQDLRFAVRNLSKQPGLALAAILTLALGIGVNSAIFSIVDSILLTPPPFREPDRVIIAWASNPALGSTEGMGTKGPASDAAFYDFQRSSHSFERMAMMQANRRVLTGQGEPELLGA